MVFVGGKPGNFPLTGSEGMERGGEGKRKGKGGRDHLPYFLPLASASNTTLLSGWVDEPQLQTSRAV